jgi:hypothetical protein
MLILASATDQVLVTTSVDAPVDVHVTWVDTNTGAGTITPGRKNTAITTNSSVNVSGTVPASTQRNVKSIHIRNKDASVAPQVQVLHTDGVNQENLLDTVLGAGKSLQYTDQGGFKLL